MPKAGYTDVSMSAKLEVGIQAVKISDSDPKYSLSDPRRYSSNEFKIRI